MSDQENGESSRDFDFHAKVLLLTYSRWSAPKEWVLEQLTRLLADKYVFITVSHEFHTDGGDHIHAVVSFIRKWRKRDQRFLDLEHPEFGRSHPNWKPKPLKHAFEYVTKHGDFVTDGDVPARLIPPEQRPLGRRDAAFAALDTQYNTVDDFMSALREKHPYEYFTRGLQIEANVRRAKGVGFNYVPAHPASSFSIPGAIQDWLDTEFDQEVFVVFEYSLRLHLGLQYGPPARGPFRYTV